MSHTYTSFEAVVHSTGNRISRNSEKQQRAVPVTATTWEMDVCIDTQYNKASDAISCRSRAHSRSNVRIADSLTLSTLLAKEPW
jgi:hypothetical protein